MQSLGLEEVVFLEFYSPAIFLGWDWTGFGLFSDTHPGLLEAVGPPAVVRVVGHSLRLLELLPQPLYPVVVAGG